jgi:glutaredoxin
MVAMTTLTRDRCPSCGAWLILVEVLYVAPAWRRYPDIGNAVVYECPSCKRAYETWARDSDPLQEMSLAHRSLRAQLAKRRPFSVS